MRKSGWSIAIVGIALGLATGGADASSDKEIASAAGQEISAYVGCLRPVVNGTAAAKIKASATLTPALEDEILENAFAACTDQREALVDKLQMPPLSFSAPQAAAGVEQLDKDLRQEIVTALRKAFSTGL